MHQALVSATTGEEIMSLDEIASDAWRDAPGRPAAGARRIPSTPHVAIVGATGAVGGELIIASSSAASRSPRLRLFASRRSAGKRCTSAGRRSRSRR